MRSTDRNRLAAATLLAVAAVIHLVAAYEPEHLENALFFGFFWGVTAVQAALALAVFRSVRWTPSIALLVNGCLIALWALTRIVPLPGEDAAEPVETLGVASKAVELAALPFLVGLLGTLKKATPSRAEPA